VIAGSARAHSGSGAESQGSGADDLFRSEARGYERALPEGARAEQGRFYTSDRVADVVVLGALALWLTQHAPLTFDQARAAVASRSAETLALFRGKTFLDPSCGAGALLAAVPRALPGIPVRLVGCDLDPGALALARVRLGKRAHLETGDAREPGPEGDVVLTNPPYGKDRSSPDIDRYVTFWGAATARVRPGGVLAVLAPRSWRTGVRYARARRTVIEAAGVRQVLDLPPGSFPDAYVDTCVALCAPGQPEGANGAEPKVRGSGDGQRRGSLEWSTVGALFLSRRGILAPVAHARGTPLLLGPVVPFVWPTERAAFSRVRPEEVVEGKAALRLDRGPRLLVRRIVGRSSRLTCVVARDHALVKKDFYLLAPRDPSLSLSAYAALLHARLITEWLAQTEEASTKQDFAQVTLTRLRQLRVPRLVRGKKQSAVAAWLEAWEREAARLGRRLAREGTRYVDRDRRWSPLRARLDAFVARWLGGTQGRPSREA
jgi:SAM-dependent methyltransferase